MLEFALSYCRRGYAVIPLWDPKENKPSKSPGWANTGDLLNLTQTKPSELLVKEWWTKMPFANIGLVIGPISLVVAMDLDPKQAQEHNRNIEETRKILETSDFLVETGQPGGLHSYFAYDEALEWTGRVHPTRPASGPLAIGPGLNLPWYLVVPPSIHPDTGVRYRWVRKSLLDFEQKDLPSLPRDFYKFQRDIREPSSARWICDLLTKTQQTKGHRTNSLTSLTGYLIEHLPTDIVAAIMQNWNASSLKIPLDPKLVERTVQSIDRTRNRNITWTKKTPLLTPSTDFPIDDLFNDNPIVHQYIQAMSMGHGIDPSMIGLTVFAAVSSCMLRRYTLRVSDNWSLPPTMLIMCGAESGQGKGIPHEHILEALKPAIRYQRDEWGTLDVVQARQDKLERLLAMQRSFLNRTKKPSLFNNDKPEDDDENSALGEFRRAIKTLKPYVENFIPFWDTGSYEKMLVTLLDQSRLNIYQTEGELFLKLLGNPSSDNSNNSTFIKAFDGEGQSYNTHLHGYRQADYTEMTIHLFIQTDLMRKLAGDNYDRKQSSPESQGLLPRFLFSMPNPLTEKYKCAANANYKKAINPSVHLLGGILEEIVKSPEKPTINPIQNRHIPPRLLPHLVRTPQIITYAEQATTALEAFREEMTSASDYGQSLYGSRRWCHRAHALAAKIAAFLHHLKDPGTRTPVSLDTTMRAIRFIKLWAIPHMQLAYKQINYGQDMLDAIDIWRSFIPRTILGESHFTYTQIAEKTRAEWTDRRKARIKNALDCLIEMNAIRPKMKNVGLTDYSQIYECNPNMTF